MGSANSSSNFESLEGEKATKKLLVDQVGACGFINSGYCDGPGMFVLSVTQIDSRE